MRLVSQVKTIVGHMWPAFARGYSFGRFRRQLLSVIH